MQQDIKWLCLPSDTKAIANPILKCPLAGGHYTVQFSLRRRDGSRSICHAARTAVRLWRVACLDTPAASSSGWPQLGD